MQSKIFATSEDDAFNRLQCPAAATNKQTETPNTGEAQLGLSLQKDMIYKIK